MFTRENVPFLWALLVFCLIAPAYGDMLAALFGWSKNYMPNGLGMFIAIGCIIMYCICMAGAFVTLMESSDQDFYEKLFGTGHYHFAWTLIVVPAVIFGFIMEAYWYAVPTMFALIWMEYARTVQNKFATYHRNEEIAKAIRNNRREKVELE